MALYEEFEPEPNRLINAHSSYLRSAAYQPVGWYEYGEEAFAEARKQDKPVFLDIGAVWCHWCHVIDRESYDDPEIATYLNELYIPVKVDRDERPDLDARYQTAVQLLSGQGGWPLTVIMTPDGKPFYGGTYFPPEDRHNRIGLKKLLPKLAETYKHRRFELEEVAHGLAERVGKAGVGAVEQRDLTEDTYRRILHGIRTRFNADQGGFELSGPKFPHSSTIELALLQWYSSGEDFWRTVVEKTLTAMGQGGIYDQLGGGFHRYSTDAQWRVPHFEKMSYDNALLLTNYVHAYRATGSEFFLDIANGTLEFLLREFADQKRGGFYSSQDADTSLNDDGAYWTWSYQEIGESLSREEFPVVARYFGITREGDIPETKRNVLAVTESPEHIAQELRISLEEVRQRLEQSLRKLREIRQQRKPPCVDTDKFANWNALCIRALLEAGTLLGKEYATSFALRTADVLINDAYEPDHGIYHAFHTDEGARLPGFLEDQVYTALALLDTFAVNGNPDHLDTARHLFDLCIEQYWDEEHGGFRDVARGIEGLTTTEFLQRSRKVIDDMPSPSANACAALGLDRLWSITHDDRFHEYARKTLETFAGHAPDYGPFAATYGLAALNHLHPPVTVTIIGELGDHTTKELWTAALEAYHPGKIIATFSPDEASLPYPADKQGKPIAYICAGENCAEPAHSADQLTATLRKFGAADV
ncbi:MAG TPA: thioredoxin domain-containing protein [Armatimonadota bacterium]|nr:thioredoxin domain-containing protein [Armatimonadota bacterium]